VLSLTEEVKNKDLEMVKLRSELNSRERRLGGLSDERQADLDKINSLTDDVTSLTETKDWYQTQLHSAQETRSVT
jgi:chromosome segregation ATPase